MLYLGTFDHLPIYPLLYYENTTFNEAIRFQGNWDKNVTVLTTSYYLKSYGLHWLLPKVLQCVSTKIQEKKKWYIERNQAQAYTSYL